MRTCHLLIVTAAIACAVATPAKAIPGGWKPIPNIDDQEIQDLGDWAVAEHVKQANDGLKFSKVVSGREQVVAGMNYELVINALNSNGKDGTYKAKLFVSLKDARRLISFSQAN